MIRVLLVHDSYLLRSALAALIQAEPEFEVACAAWRDARSRARSLQPHVCVVDTDCPGSDKAARKGELGKLMAEAPAAENGPESGLLVLANAGRPGQLRRAHKARALGYIDKNAPPQRLLDGIRHVAKQERFIDDSLGYGFLKAAEIPLTERELGVLSLAADGASIAEIARTLHLSNGTIRNYLAAITRKTGARNRVDAIRISRCEGWV
ncbi:response regulator transcription factor [Streptomyces sp. Rer75]|uniref:response regulator transcription factor n=1 Tax=unclassified Streptomyces TaxID=2593676 RepID=UPI0015D09302|nr:response regulator transcription factor [Streptomyces sp. Rer75]QLH21416.1 response regulator transcription factor [Streptomyces sp. Rer75]